MLARNMMRAAARRAVVQSRFCSVKASEAKPEELTTGEFRHYDQSDAYKYSPDVTPFSAWGLVIIALQIQFLIVFGEGEPEFPFIDSYRHVMEG